MKKLFFALLIVAFGIPQIGNATVSTTPVTGVLIDEFKKIDPSELPPAVVQTLIKDYPTSRLRQAFKNKQGKYKLIMVLKSGTQRTVYIDAYGRWITKK